MSAAAAISVGFDPTRDKTYRRAKLAGDVVDWLATTADVYTHTSVQDVARHMAMLEEALLREES